MESNVIFGIFSGLVLAKGINMFYRLYNFVKEKQFERSKILDDTVETLNKKMEHLESTLVNKMSNLSGDVNTKIAEVISSINNSVNTEKGSYKTAASWTSNNFNALKNKINNCNEYELKKYREFLDGVMNREILVDKEKDKKENLDKKLQEILDDGKNIENRILFNSVLPEDKKKSDDSEKDKVCRNGSKCVKIQKELLKKDGWTTFDNNTFTKVEMISKYD
jgi:hypothetical protein